MARILVISGDGGGENIDYAMFRMREEGHEVTLAAPRKKRLHILFFQQEEGWDTYREMPWYAWDADASLDDIDPTTYDGLLLPGGRAPWYLRTTRSGSRSCKESLCTAPLSPRSVSSGSTSMPSSTPTTKTPSRSSGQSPRSTKNVSNLVSRTSDSGY